MGIVFKCLSKGAVDFLVKPIQKNELKHLWQHVWRKCHTSGYSGSESGVMIQKPSSCSGNIGHTCNKFGGSVEDENWNTDLNGNNGSDNGSDAQFSFAKVWLLAPQFEMRQLNLIGARSILGQAIGKAPKDKIFRKYIEIELQLGNIDRCRKLYEKYLEWSPENCYAWSKYAELERSLSETDRVRAIFELGIAQPQEALFATISSDQDNSDSRRRYLAI
ncbi:hypothetical protein POM88_045913 [Heracleum sosnowskyi]|uniref:Response regulatory domain-containing protein n=1 Tax=Heracleum sosnowskyi TaxID=360622 RepID=A0AAD8H830_9APIA|nr:hypothetical protein POM88_045913 [Heracleum sosnowskyi]